MTATTTPLVEIHHLKKHFPIHSALIIQRHVGAVKAVDDVSFDIYQGETLGLVGETGCGKTTVGRTMLRLYEPTSGQIICQQPLALRQEDFPDLNSLQNGFEREQLAWQALLDSLDPEEIEGQVNLTTLRGHNMAFSRWRILQHLVLHGMQHHTELAQLLTAKGQSPGNIDFIFFF